MCGEGREGLVGERAEVEGEGVREGQYRAPIMRPGGLKGLGRRGKTGFVNSDQGESGGTFPSQFHPPPHCRSTKPKPQCPSFPLSSPTPSSPGPDLFSTSCIFHPFPSGPDWRPICPLLSPQCFHSHSHCHVSNFPSPLFLLTCATTTVWSIPLNAIYYPKGKQRHMPRELYTRTSNEMQ